jgi:UDP-N-acetylmuramate: L-alanyl-gamma-D-glutamyl-meso-diaminopimelate ligase
MQGFDQENMVVLTEAEELADFLKKQDYTNTVLLLMSSGNFGGLPLEKLVSELCAK